MNPFLSDRQQGARIAMREGRAAADAAVDLTGGLVGRAVDIEIVELAAVHVVGGKELIVSPRPVKRRRCGQSAHDAPGRPAVEGVAPRICRRHGIPVRSLVSLE